MNFADRLDSQGNVTQAAADPLIEGARLYDAETGEEIKHVVMFRLTDSRVWTLDGKAWEDADCDDDEALAAILTHKRPFVVRHRAHPDREWRSGQRAVTV